MYRLLGDTLKAGALAAYMLGGTSIAAMSMGAEAADGRRLNFIGIRLRDNKTINTFNVNCLVSNAPRPASHRPAPVLINKVAEPGIFRIVIILKVRIIAANVPDG
jgi:hypothetical protein